ncbi:MAG TPA: hypothetical protein VGR55_18605 [Candidatus Acidoferrum sp.]|nr:hypothetical protein [Candidatus Acidoferrum sp.]
MDALKRIRPDSFFLSHFHADHYNGLFGVGPNEKFGIVRVFYPRLPVFSERKEFMVAMLAVSNRVLGGITGSQEADFLNQIRLLARGTCKYRALSKGDVVEIGGSHFEVLWPPEMLELEATLSKVRKAIKDFETALEEDSVLKQIDKRVREGKVVEEYLRNNSDQFLFPEREIETDLKRPAPPDALPKAVLNANKSLRDAANHMSLALYEDNRLLFLGDLEKHELKEVVKDLALKRRTNFLATVTPHHGTHWHSTLGQIQTHYAISSAGEKLIGHFCQEFKSFGAHCLVTHSNGDIHVSNPFLSRAFEPTPPYRCGRGFWTL